MKPRKQKTTNQKEYKNGNLSAVEFRVRPLRFWKLETILSGSRRKIDKIFLIARLIKSGNNFIDDLQLIRIKIRWNVKRFDEKLQYQIVQTKLEVRRNAENKARNFETLAV